MQRRPFLAALSTAAVLGGAGCLGAEGSYRTVPDDYEGPAGRYQWGYDARNSHYAAGLAGPEDAPTLQRVYTETGGNPLTDDGRLYTHSTAIEYDGTRLWHEPGKFEPRADIVLYEDHIVIIGGSPAQCWAIDRVDGSEDWRIELGTGLSGGLLGWLTLTVLGDHAYYSTDAGVAAVDLAGQDVAWHADLMVDRDLSEMTTEWANPAATPDHVFTVNDLQTALTDAEPEPRLYALDRGSGETDWTIDIDGEAWAFDPVIVGDEYVFLLSFTEDPPAVEEDGNWTQIVAVDPGAGEVAWREALPGGTWFGPAVMGDRLFVDHGDQLSAIDAADGSIVWSETLESPEASVTATEEFIYVVDTQYVHAFDPANGDNKWRLDLVEAIDGIEQVSELAVLPAHPIVEDGRLFLYYDIETVAGFW